MARSTVSFVTVGEVADALDSIAPPGLAQSWDNVGLLVGDRKARCRHVLLCIDLTPRVLAEAVAKKCELVLAYHPPLFRPITSVLADASDTSAIIHAVIAEGLAVYSPHTALDAAPGGTNDVMARLCKLSHVQPLEYMEPSPSQSKLVTFVPESHVEEVASAMFAAGGGRIGDYQRCSYRVRGEGTFWGGETTKPRVGRPGRLERVGETRLEVLACNNRLPEVIAALGGSHPYEEPAFDVYPLTAPPVAGIGRVGMLPRGTTLGGLARSLRRSTRSRVATMVGRAGTRVRRAVVCVGAAGRMPLEGRRSSDCDVIVTGEIRHHDALAIRRSGKTGIALGHWESERPLLAPLARRLTAAVGTVTTTISRRDASPFNRP